MGVLRPIIAATQLERGSAAALTRLTEELALAFEEPEIVRIATRVIGEHLAVQRCGFVEIERGSGTLKVIPGWLREPVPSLAGRHELQSLGDAEWQRRLGSVRIAIDDVITCPHTRDYAEAYRARGVRAYAGVPFMREGQWLATLTVTSDQPRRWRDEELALLEQAIARVWPLIERARSHAVLHLITTNAPVVLACFDRESRVVFANHAFAARWSLAPAELVGKSLADIIGQEAFVVVRPYIEQALGGATVQFEVEMPYRDLGRRYVQISCVPDCDSQGRVRGYLSAVSDLTERRAIEQAARENEQRYKQLIMALPVAVYTCDPEGRLTLYNEAAAELWGRRPELGVERWGGACAVYASDGRQLPREEWSLARMFRHRNAGPPEEFIVERPNGECRTVVSHPQLLHDPTGTLIGAINVLVDITERQQAERARLEIEERFRALAQHAPVGIFQTDARGECCFVNEQWCRMAGLDGDDARGRGWLAAVHPDDRQRVEGEWQGAIQNGRPFACEYRFMRSDGVVTWLQASAIDFRDANGVALGHIGTVVDITERKTAEFALRESEKRFRMLASRAPVGIFMANPQGETVFVNANWCTMAGLTPEQAHGKGWAHAIHPEDRARVMKEWEDAVRNGVSSKAEFRFLRRDGAITWVHGIAVQLRDSNGRLSGYIGTVADFTERKQAELALRESEARFRLLADNIVQFAWICDRTGKLLWINRRFSDYSGLTVEDMTASGTMALHHPDHVARVTAKFEEHLASGQGWEDTFPLRGRSGTYRWFLSRAIPVYEENGQISRWFGTNTDITDLRDTQEMLRQAQEELLAHAGDLERKIEARTASLREAIVQMEEFSYSVSHDLRAPLRAMNAYADALIEDYGPRLDDTARDYLSRIRRSSQRMEKLTHDVLTYSRLARAEVVLGPVDLNAVLRDLIGQYAELQSTAAEVRIEEPLARVRGHELSLGQCLGNLLTNAAKFVAPGVRPLIRVYTAESAGNVRICVADNGIGIKPEHQRNLFQMFERVPTMARYDGTGIGLAIVRKAAEKMGGRCGIESDGATGSTFWIELPRA